MKLSKYRVRRLNTLRRLRSTSGKQWRHLYNKGSELYEECQRKGNPAHLAEAISNFREALALCRRGHPKRSVTLGSLGNALYTRYKQEGNVDNLSLAITYHQENLVLRPVGDPNRFATLNDLGRVLRARYNREGNVDDLSLTILYHQEQLALCPAGHPHRSPALNNLGVVLGKRYNQGRNVDDLSLSIAYFQEDLLLRPVGDPGRSATLNNLGNALRKRYYRAGNVDDLSLSIACHQEALALRQPGHPDRSGSLYNLANTLETRYQREGNADDLALSMSYRHEVLVFRPPGHPGRSQALRDLAYCYWTSRNEQEAPATITRSLDPAACHLGESSSNSPSEQVERAAARYDSPDASTNMIISLIREASRNENCSPRDWLKASLSWIEYSKVIDPASTTEAYITAFHQLDIVLALGQSLEHRQKHLLSDDLMVETRGLGDEAATWALQQGEPERAVEFLEQGRSLLLAQLGRYRTELEDLRQVHSNLADRFETLSQRLDSFLVSNSKIAEGSSEGIDPYEKYRRLSTEWNATVEMIRTIPNFETFLKPLPYEQLRRAAAEGPIIIIVPGKKCSNALIVREHEPIHCVCLPLANSSRLAELSNSILESLQPDDATGNRTEGQCLSSIKSLWNGVVGPIARALQYELGVPLHSRVWWCPTSMTSFLPLHAAGLYSPGKPRENFPNLYTSSYTPTLHALLRARRDTNPSGPKKLLIVAQPAAPGKPPLRYAMEEAAFIKKIVLQNQHVEMLVDKAGTCEAVQRQMESHPWMHFICHGIQADQQPLDSYLLLHDGPLTLRMIIQQNLPNADFAFLSACHSAAGDKVLANEALHLAAAMQFAGFRGVVGTLWEMADDNGPPLAEAFYRELVKDGDSRGAAKALCEAIKQLRRNKVPLNLWMRFVHIGI